MLSLICKVFLFEFLLNCTLLERILCDHQNLAKLADFCDELVKQTNKFFRFCLPLKKGKNNSPFSRPPHHGNIKSSARVKHLLKKKLLRGKNFAILTVRKFFPPSP